MKKEYKITYEQAQQIIDSACDTWKIKLVVQWSIDIVLKKEITISETFYNEMRKACTKDQNELFDEIFGKVEEPSPYKNRELIFVRDYDDGVWQLRYYSHFEGGKVHTYERQRKVGNTLSWKLHAPAKGVKLPD